LPPSIGRAQPDAGDDDHHRRFDLVSSSDDGAQGDNDSDRASISADGRYVAFASLADNLVPNGQHARSHLWDSIIELQYYT
jgi:hypothetical protein